MTSLLVDRMLSNRACYDRFNTDEILTLMRK